MLSNPIVVKRGSKGEAEKPFWISYADLMTALMVLVLGRYVGSHACGHELRQANRAEE